jgi:P4 family phage/plasmid primase-like protien
MRNDTLGMGTLRWWAKKDNSDEYEKILSENVMVLVDVCIGSDGAHYDVARVVHALYKDAYRFVGRDCWYVYRPDKHRWIRSREGLQLRLLLSNEIVRKFMERSLYWANQALINEEDRERFKEKSDKLSKITIKLKTSNYKDGVMKECKGLFTDERFEETLDSKPHLIGFENGVYDLRMHEFREGLPDDYISFTTGRDYQDYDPASEEAIGLEAFFDSVFTNPEVRTYVKDILTCVLDGGIRQERFYVFTGNGCHAKDTPILMYDGTVRSVQTIAPGDTLMGDDGTPRTVQHLYRGRDAMFKITPIKGESFIVNSNHILSLKFTNLTVLTERRDGYYETNPHYRVSWYVYPDEKNSTYEPIKKSKTFKTKEEAEKFKECLNEPGQIHKGDIIDISVQDLLRWNPWWIHKSNITLYKSNTIPFSEKQLDLDPYMFGYWLGDGHSAGSCITTMNEEVVEYFNEKLNDKHKMTVYALKGQAKTYGISSHKGNTNLVTAALRNYNLINNKHIPYIYKTASVEQRKELLAGIIDSDGHYQKHCNQYEITLKNKKLMEDVVYVARSLGYACYMKQVHKTCTNSKNGNVTGTYYRTQIYGKGIETIPCKLDYKCSTERVKNKDALLNGFQIQQVDDNDFYGFELDGNHRYVMGDFTVTHNSNGKSKILELVQKAIGDYYCILPIALLTQKRTASNSAQSELERTKGRRFAIMQEPGESEKLNTGLMKELSGGDRILVRGLFKEPIEFRPQFKMILTCNELPEVQSDDGGTWRRIRVIQFTSKFVERPNPAIKTEFPIDLDLSEKFELWADQFVAMLINHHKNFDPKKMTEPMEVRIATEGYKKNNDLIGQYVSERIVRDDHCTKRLQLNRVYNDFRQWTQQFQQKGKRTPDRNQFRAYVEKSHGAYPSDGKGWRFLRMVSDKTSDDSDADDSDADTDSA